jgi:YspA, cpYpsA-related SLOG family
VRQAVLVSGYRKWTDAAAIEDRLSRYKKGTLLIHGAATGADSLAQSIGKNLGFVNIPVPYFQWLGKAGGPARNEVMLMMLKQCRLYGYKVYVEAFLHPKSKGTRHMIGLVETYNSPGIVHIKLHVTEG